MTVRIPRTGQIRLSGHISASFNQNSGSQTHMNNNAVLAACHNTLTWSPGQRSMNAAHGVITALMLTDRYVNTNYGTNAYNWAANASTFNTIYNKQDTRADGDVWSSSTYRAPSCEDYGNVGHQLNMWMYGSNPGAIYCQQLKKVNKLTSGEQVPFRVDMATGSSEAGWGCSAQAYLYNYSGSYLSSTRLDGISLQSVGLSSSNWTGSWTESNSPDMPYGLYMPYEYIVLGYRGFTQYPGYNFRGDDLRVRPYYLRLIATSGYA